MPDSPILPPFGIRELNGPDRSPGLIAITAGQYNQTLKSQPDAPLLYLDDDDGELITVGSGFELSQRLDEPVPTSKNGRSTLRNPSDGELIHIFDITQSSGSLVAWRDHEAYSSKHFRSQRPTSPSLHSEPTVLSECEEVLHDRQAEIVVHPKDEKSDVSEASSATEETVRRYESPAINLTAASIVDGIEEHLSGLATVLSIAASTLQKAADKTRETDTSVIEDVLKGVKGILTEVGSFGLEAFRALEAETSSTSIWQADESNLASSEDNVTASEIAAEAVPVRAQTAKTHDKSLTPQDETAPLKQAMIERDLVEAYTKLEQDDRCQPSPKVKFALDESITETVNQEPVHPLRSAFSSPSLRQPQVEDFEKYSEANENPFASPVSAEAESFLDDVEEDADFTARFPPLLSVRRAQTVNASSKPRYQPYSRRHLSHDFTSTLHTNASSSKANTEKAEHGRLPDIADSIYQPLPGSWPDSKPDKLPAVLPASKESSGSFFNRMTGRNDPASFALDTSISSLRRVNTTAASNPASRLNGPFDPAFPDVLKPKGQKLPAPLKVESSRNDLDRSQSDATRYRHTRPIWAQSNRKNTAREHPLFAGTKQLHHSTQQLFQPPSPPTRSILEPFPPSFFQAPPPPPPNMSRPPPPPPMPRGPRHFASVPNFMPPPPPRSQMLYPSGSPGAFPQSSLAARPNPPPAPYAPSTFPPPQRDSRIEPAAAQPKIYQPPTVDDFEPEPILSIDPPMPSKYDSCVEQLKAMGFDRRINGEDVANRLHVYAVAADGDVAEAVEMIEEDRAESQRRSIGTMRTL